MFRACVCYCNNLFTHLTLYLHVPICLCTSLSMYLFIYITPFCVPFCLCTQLSIYPFICVPVCAPPPGSCPYFTRVCTAPLLRSLRRIESSMLQTQTAGDHANYFTSFLPFLFFIILACATGILDLRFG